MATRNPPAATVRLYWPQLTDRARAGPDSVVHLFLLPCHQGSCLKEFIVITDDARKTVHELLSHLVRQGLWMQGPDPPVHKLITREQHGQQHERELWMLRGCVRVRVCGAGSCSAVVAPEWFWDPAAAQHTRFQVVCYDPKVWQLNVPYLLHHEEGCKLANCPILPVHYQPLGPRAVQLSAATTAVTNNFSSLMSVRQLCEQLTQATSVIGAMPSGLGPLAATGRLSRPAALRPASLPLPRGLVLASEAAQHALGLAAAWLLWPKRSWLAEVAGPWLGGRLYHHLSKDLIAWLMTAKPFGVKLHAELAHLLGWALHLLLDISAHVGAALWPPAASTALCILVAVSGVLGFCPAVCVAHDLLVCLSSPLALAHAAVATVYRAHLWHLAESWGMMRGQLSPKRGGSKAQAAGAAPAGAAEHAGALRRTQAGQQGRDTATPHVAVKSEELLGAATSGQDKAVVMERIIVGVLLFVPLLALLPTSFVWYLASSLLLLALLLLRTALLLLAKSLSPNVPLLILWRLLCPLSFPSGHVLVQAMELVPGTRPGLEGRLEPLHAASVSTVSSAGGSVVGASGGLLRRKGSPEGTRALPVHLQQGQPDPVGAASGDRVSQAGSTGRGSERASYYWASQQARPWLELLGYVWAEGIADWWKGWPATSAMGWLQGQCFGPLRHGRGR